MGRVNTKFKAGDKVRVVRGGEFDVGTILTVLENDGGEYIPLLCECSHGASSWLDAGDVEHYEEPTQASTHNENLVLTRLFNAEAEVDRMSRSIDELQRRIETLEKANDPKYVLDELIGRITDGNRHIPKYKSPTRTANQRRADVIKRAEAFVAEIESEAGRSLAQDDSYIPFVKENGGTFIEFIVNAEKRTVVAFAHFKFAGGIAGKAFARCAPGDVFNDSIGKAIAAGRLYGVDIPREFLDAPQPTDVVVGMRVQRYNYIGENLGVMYVNRVRKARTFDMRNNPKNTLNINDGYGYSEEYGDRILDDSGAVYE